MAAWPINRSRLSGVICLWRAARVVLHLAHGIARVLIEFPHLSHPQRNTRVQHWSARLLHILAVRIDVSGTLAHGAAPVMIVANHVSWLDIYALNALYPAHFVAKSEVGRWPLIGLFARKSGTVFIERARRRDILRVNAELAALMRAGVMIAVFPEGTTTEGDRVLPFRPLLQAAVACDARLQAVAIRYERANGSRCAEASFVGDTTFAAALWRVLTLPVILVRLQFLPAVSCGGQHRKALARAAQRSIGRALGPQTVAGVVSAPSGASQAGALSNHAVVTGGGAQFVPTLPCQPLPELTALERLIERAPRGVKVRTACMVEAAGQQLPIHTICLGNPDRSVPAIGFFGGVHGLERIGTHVLLHFLEDLFARLATDLALNYRLEHLRLVFMPLVNPGGMLGTTRSNPRGVDLMRNGQVDAASKVPFLIGGQRLSPLLPWYRGAGNSAMEPESGALCRLVEDELLGRKFAVALDCHSGFGFRDRIWFPYAHTKAPIHHLPEIHALTALFEQRHPEHNYVIEPQSHQYLAHGDLWDHLYRSSLAQPGSVFLPLTLEMGSWRWISKYPRQLLSKLGLFNPLPADRRERVLRHHLPWLEFLIRMGSDSAKWLPAGAVRAAHADSASARWYPQA